MNYLLQLLIGVRHWLASIHPFAPVLAIAIGEWFAVYSLRRWFPSLWLRLEALVPEGAPTSVANTLLALPVIGFGAVFAIGTSGDVSPEMAFLGATGGALAPALHHLLKRLPIAYRGAVRQAATARLGRFFGGSLLVLLSGCGPNPAEEAQSIIDRWSCEDAAEGEWKARAAEKCPLPKDCEEGRAEVCPKWENCPHHVELEKELERLQASCRGGRF